jgi:hypothetical protein
MSPEFQKFSSLASNTTYLSSDNPRGEQIYWLVPPKIRNRIRLNQLGLNGLATTIIPPEQTGNLSLNKLAEITTFSNQVNFTIGLPPSHDLIVRTGSIGRKRRFLHPQI